jgi:hypothetical protein|tara:strand:+ start:2054 stop:2758 length:705 start_codon:yes stop_codon:yes gene_type:complete
MQGPPDPRKIKFFRENKEVIDKKVRSENVRRSRRDIDPLSDDEIDQAIQEMMEMAADNGRVQSYKFPMISKPIEPQDHGPSLTINKPQIPKIKGANIFTFEAKICSNGYLLSVANNNDIESYIFKDENDLVEIFRETVFSNLKESKNESGNGSSEQNDGRRNDLLEKNESGQNGSHAIQVGERKKHHRRRRRKKVRGGIVNSAGTNETSHGEGGTLHQPPSRNQIPAERAEGGD